MGSDGARALRANGYCFTPAPRPGFIHAIVARPRGGRRSLVPERWRDQHGQYARADRTTRCGLSTARQYAAAGTSSAPISVSITSTSLAGRALRNASTRFTIASPICYFDSDGASRSTSIVISWMASSSISWMARLDGHSGFDTRDGGTNPGVQEVEFTIDELSHPCA